MHFGSSLSLSCHLHVHGHPCVLFTLVFPFYFLLYLPLLFLFLNYLKSVVNLHNSCNESMDSTDEFSLSTEWDCFKTPILQEILRVQKSASGGTLCIFGSHTLVPISWMCKKQTSVSHSSTESEIISLDTGLRLDGLLALDLWDLIVSVL